MGFLVRGASGFLVGWMRGLERRGVGEIGKHRCRKVGRSDRDVDFDLTSFN